MSIVLFIGYSLYTKNFFSVLRGLLFERSIQLKRANSSINMLVLGIGGVAHEGPNLTDTIMFASIDPEKNIVNIVSVPRDLWIPDLLSKINFAYSIGESKGNKGDNLAKAVVERVVGKKIDYITVVDFAAFVDLVDILGGIDVLVDKAFDDYEYPNEVERENLCGHSLDEATELIATMSATEVFPCRYQHVRFDQGITHMDGQTALIYVRSRHAQGEEGTDFARSKRQQKVINAIRDKATSLGILLNPLKIYQIYETLEKNIKTTITKDEFDDFIRLAQKMKDAKIQSYIIDAGNEKTNEKGLLMNPPITKEYNLQWVLIPEAGNGNFSEIHTFVNCIIHPNKCQTIQQ